MVPESWTDAEAKLKKLEPIVEEKVRLSAADIAKYPLMNDNGEHLSQLLANLNWYVQGLGELQPQAEAIKTWTEKFYEAEKGIEKTRLVKQEKMAIGLADGAKYQSVVQYIDIMVRAGALHMRVQNARSSARDTTEAIRSRIGQLRGQQRSV